MLSKGYANRPSRGVARCRRQCGRRNRGRGEWTRSATRMSGRQRCSCRWCRC